MTPRISVTCQCPTPYSVSRYPMHCSLLLFISHRHLPGKMTTTRTPRTQDQALARLAEGLDDPSTSASLALPRKYSLPVWALSSRLCPIFLIPCRVSFLALPGLSLSLLSYPLPLLALVVPFSRSSGRTRYPFPPRVLRVCVSLLSASLPFLCLCGGSKLAL